MQEMKNNPLKCSKLGCNEIIDSIFQSCGHHTHCSEHSCKYFKRRCPQCREKVIGIRNVSFIPDTPVNTGDTPGVPLVTTEDAPDVPLVTTGDTPGVPLVTTGDAPGDHW